MCGILLHMALDAHTAQEIAREVREQLAEREPLSEEERDLVSAIANAARALVHRVDHTSRVDALRLAARLLLDVAQDGLEQRYGARA